MRVSINPRMPWLLLYVFVNILAAGIMLYDGELIGDMAGNPLYSKSALVWAVILVIASYLLILGPAFHVVSKITIKSINWGRREVLYGERIGKLLIILQLLYIVFNMTTGVNIAGSANTRTDSSFAMLWVLIPVDSLFVIYYGFYRENKFFYPNLIIWLVSNFLRGWAGIFLFVIFFEWCRTIRKKKITLKRIVFFASIGLIIISSYPFLTQLKWLIRSSAGTNLSFDAILGGLAHAFDGQNYVTLIGDGLLHIVARLQVSSIVIEVMRLSDVLKSAFFDGKFTPFWMEGLHGIVFDRIFLGEKSMPIGVFFTSVGDFNWQFTVGDWNTNIGYVGWFFIAPYLALFYVLYTLFLGFLSFFIVKLINISKSAEDMLWLIWLVYLMPPWLAVFVNFIYALCVFLVMKIIVARIPHVRLGQKSSAVS